MLGRPAPRHEATASEDELTCTNANYFVRPARGKLAPFVECFWYFEGSAAPRLETLLPSCSCQLLVNLDVDRLSWYEGGSTPRAIRGAGFSGCQTAAFAVDVAQ